MASIPTPLSEPRARIRHLKWALRTDKEPIRSELSRCAQQAAHEPSSVLNYNCLSPVGVDGPASLAKELVEVSNILRAQHNVCSSFQSFVGSPTRNDLVQQNQEEVNCENEDIFSFPNSPAVSSSRCHTPSTRAPASSVRPRPHTRPPPALDVAFIEDSAMAASSLPAGPEGSVGDISNPSTHDLTHRYCDSEGATVMDNEGHFLHGTAQLGGGHVLHASVFVPFRESHVGDLKESGNDNNSEGSSTSPAANLFPFTGGVQSEPTFGSPNVNGQRNPAIDVQPFASLPCLNPTQRAHVTPSMGWPQDSSTTAANLDMTTPPPPLRLHQELDSSECRLDPQWDSSSSSEPCSDSHAAEVDFEITDSHDNVEVLADHVWDQMVMVARGREVLRGQLKEIAAEQQRLRSEAQDLQSQMQSADAQHERLKEACDEAQRDLYDKRRNLNAMSDAKADELRSLRESLDAEIRARASLWSEQDRLRQQLPLHTA